MTPLMGFLLVLGVLNAVALLWPRCPKCKELGRAIPGACDSEDHPEAYCTGCGHIYSPVED